MRHSILSIAVRVSALILLYTFTAPASDAVAQTEGYWGHCVIWTGGTCTCKAGPSNGGQYHCFSSGSTCHDLFPDACSL